MFIGFLRMWERSLDIDTNWTPCIQLSYARLKIYLNFTWVLVGAGVTCDRAVRIFCPIKLDLQSGWCNQSGYFSDGPWFISVAYYLQKALWRLFLVEIFGSTTHNKKLKWILAKLGGEGVDIAAPMWSIFLVSFQVLQKVYIQISPNLKYYQQPPPRPAPHG